MSTSCVLIGILLGIPHAVRDANEDAARGPWVPCTPGGGRQTRGLVAPRSPGRAPRGAARCTPRAFPPPAWGPFHQGTGEMHFAGPQVAPGGAGDGRSRFFLSVLGFLMFLF